jgi:hypothetical protein
MGTMSLERRLLKIEASLQPGGWIWLVEVYTPQAGVGWSAPGCETEARAMARMPSVGPDDILFVAQAWGCPRQGTPHSHADDPIQRWPRL